MLQCLSFLLVIVSAEPDRLDTLPGVFGERDVPAYYNGVQRLLLTEGGREVQMVTLASFKPEEAVYALRSDKTGCTVVAARIKGQVWGSLEEWKARNAKGNGAGFTVSSQAEEKALHAMDLKVDRVEVPIRCATVDRLQTAWRAALRAARAPELKERAAADGASFYFSDDEPRVGARSGVAHNPDSPRVYALVRLGQRLTAFARAAVAQRAEIEQELVDDATTLVANLAAASPTPGAAGPGALAAADLPTALELRALGEAIIAKLATSNAAWTRTEFNEKGVGIRIDVMHSPDADKFEFSVVRDGRAAPLGFIVARKTVWLSRFEKEQVTRPYEAVLPLPALYWHLSRVAPVPVRARTDGIVVRSDAKTITFVAGIPADKRELIGKARLEILRNKSPDGGVEAPLAMLAKLDALMSPFEVTVDRATGFEIEAATRTRKVVIEGFTFITDDVSSELTALPATTKPPPAPTRDELVRSILFSYLPTWKPGGAKGDLDLVLFDPKMGSLRRVPSVTGGSTGGAFVLDRTRVVVTASLPDDGSNVPFEIDLLTGANRRLAGDTLSRGVSLFPTASPDRAKVSVLSAAGEPAVNNQLSIIDLKGGASKPVGSPFDQAFASWLPDGSGFIILSRYPVDGSLEKRHVITRLSLNGDRTAILEGATHPLLMGDGKTILFQTRDTAEWKSCDLAGQGIKRFGSGFKGYGSPTLSPDGTSVLMIKHDPAGKHPMVIRLSDFSETPLMNLPGLWASPSWR